MPASLTAGRLYRSHKDKLALEWVAGRSGESRTICLPTEKSSEAPPVEALVGHLNLIHPSKIQIIGRAELDYLISLKKNSFDDAVKTLFENSPFFVVISHGESAPEKIVKAAEASKIPLFSSKLAGHILIGHLQYYLLGLLAERLTLHGVFMEVLGLGVLITGESGVGKSELALELITRGHRLIADDVTEFFCVAPETVNGLCPALLRGYLEVRGLGILNIKEMFGDSAIKKENILQLNVNLQKMNKETLSQIDRLQGGWEFILVSDVKIPKITLPVAPGRNLAVLVESAVRNHLLRMKGYNSAQKFIEHQIQKMDAESSA